VGEFSPTFSAAVNELEYQSMGELDPMSEEETSPVPHVTQRYPDRLILNVTNVCGSYCRFCQRRRCHGVKDLHVQLSDLEPAFNYIKKHREIRDVLYVVNMTGGLGKVNLRTEANVSSLDENPILFKTWENKIVPY
jgi:L-lysine 2,3-aminomutase